MSTTAGMKGGGYYDDHSEYQRKVAESGSALIEECAAGVPPLPPDQTFVIVDYGSSTGANSLAAVSTAVAAVRRREATRPVAAVHNDLPTNDWNELFTNLAARDDSYVKLEGPAVLTLASAISFFEPAVPAASAQLGLSFSAAHWLRSQPTVTVSDGFYFCEATGAARDTLAAEADADWTTFLASRAADLAPGGRLLVQMVGSEPQPAPAEPNITSRKLMRAMAEVARDLVDEGTLDGAVVERYLLPVYARTTDEARAPLERADSPVSKAFAIETIRVDPVANPYLAQWEKDGDAGAYAKSYAAFARGFTESSLRQHLFEPGVTAGVDVDTVLDDYFGRLTARFAADPTADPFEDWTLTVVLTRR